MCTAGKRILHVTLVECQQSFVKPAPLLRRGRGDGQEVKQAKVPPTDLALSRVTLL